MTYGEQIKKARERKRLTQEALAEQLGVSRQAVSKWEADKARPAASKLAALSAALEIPEDVWDAIDKENAPTPVAAPSNQSWKLVTTALAVLLAASLALNGALLVRGGDAQEPPQSSTPPPVEEPSSTEPPTAADLSTMFPETLPLEAEPFPGFEPIAYTGQIWEDLPGQQEHWSGTIGGDSRTPAFFLRVVKANPIQEIGTTFWDVYLLYAPGDSRGAEWNLLLQLAQENHYVNNGNSFQAEPFSCVLGRDGIRISLAMGASYTADHYIALTPDGALCHLETANTEEFDVDEDGELELISASCGLPLRWEIYDSAGSKGGVSRWTLSPMEDVVLGFDAARGGFLVDDSQGKLLVRYVLRNGQMVRQPLTDITVADYPDVIGTQLTITLSGFSDSVHPDTVLLLKNGIRITPRQQAYLALQELYNLTGVTVPECHCAVSSSGVIRFTLPQSKQDCFYSVSLPEKYGGIGIPRLELAWQELGNSSSPLKLADHPELDDLQLYARLNSNRVLGWYYEQLRLLHSGETAHINHQDLWLTDGRRYTAQLRDTVYGPALVSLYGPYSG